MQEPLQRELPSSPFITIDGSWQEDGIVTGGSCVCPFAPTKLELWMYQEHAVGGGHAKC
jgi:hypothetical protein